MTSTGMSCLILADGTYVDSNKIMGSGLDGYIVRDPGASIVMKIPKLFVELFRACHARRVLVFDIALRNLMLADNLSIRAIDFANGSLLPLSGDEKLVDSRGYTADVDILHVTNVIYSIACWKKFQVDCVAINEWPAAETLPSTADLPLGQVIVESWSHQFKSLDELKRAIMSAASHTPAIPRDGDHTIQKPVFLSAPLPALLC
ncbi:hypothetical protein AUEXF2481DRAFT_535290 [Aureobasidium subglaciale EXF-2481]|uniref:Protein kinase domain-containing protein n=1 Tax=Aureobasidium subglaciale (strain EXF-2481) TaxID=1043005 RepID=A0A074XZ42_AURSE|nr:uncharacterized protein AUEXF2481DRAFT_535290 [Aureobasidium subglaciale EXF-2481]KAI5201528.1 hypothetical protein E4T38_06048 [Aureobasidium subglaciale]KAI5220078.1 hypothetical protein E4T40_06069 [Aureobasidium subglaciale]KAI5223980.1 hypothetical protein E4T41_05909 [Aureobasidium subglaciale]KAI5260647.1 hypothetical protein E4T46_05803 [Aureobasidium subglaciale]KEQ90705.1 hypothetical protein AUEXF2481DRAFT_535290 [Aureobasidium subglaciale EXF-2481]